MRRLVAGNTSRRSRAMMRPAYEITTIRARFGSPPPGDVNSGAVSRPNGAVALRVVTTLTGDLDDTPFAWSAAT